MAQNEISVRFEQATPPPLLPPKKGWRSKLGLSGLLIGAVLFSVLGGGGVAGFHAFNILYQSKLTDTWAILFLNLERQCQRLSKEIQDNLKVSTAGKPAALLQVVGEKKLHSLRGGSTTDLSLESLGVSLERPQDEIQFIQLDGKDYLSRFWTESSASELLEEKVPAGDYLALWPVDLRPLLKIAQEKSVSDLYYFATKGGKLVYSSRSDVTAANFSSRNIVQKFISHPLRQGQLEFSREGSQWYGLFHEVPGTNILLFAETSSWMVLATVREKGVQFLIGLFLILAVVLILVQFPISGVVTPIRELVELVQQVAQGNFDVHPSRSAFGELSILSHSINDMARRLLVRDTAIQELLVVQDEKIRMQKEMGLAQSIQANFLIESDLPVEAGVEVASSYIPAMEVGGDWYGYFYNEKTEESVFALADVTGHGAGPALFTAVIASVFEEQIEVSKDTSAPFPMSEFAQRANRLILNLGRGKVNATLQLACFKKGDEQIRLLNAGNPFPWVIFPSELGKEIQIVPMRSDPLGASPEVNLHLNIAEFPRGAVLLMFSDGLIEGRSDHKLYPETRMKKACEFSSHHTTKQFMDRLFKDWTDYLEGDDRNDDFCVLAVRAL